MKYFILVIVLVLFTVSCFAQQAGSIIEGRKANGAFVGSPASTTNALNAATYSASISVTDNVIKIIGSGDVGAEWVVKKLEVK